MFLREIENNAKVLGGGGGKQSVLWEMWKGELRGFVTIRQIFVSACKIINFWVAL